MKNADGCQQPYLSSTKRFSRSLFQQSVRLLLLLSSPSPSTAAMQVYISCGVTSQKQQKLASTPRFTQHLSLISWGMRPEFIKAAIRLLHPLCLHAFPEEEAGEGPLKTGTRKAERCDSRWAFFHSFVRYPQKSLAVAAAIQSHHVPYLRPVERTTRVSSGHKVSLGYPKEKNCILLAETGGVSDVNSYRLRFEQNGTLPPPRPPRKPSPCLATAWIPC